tara:strand:- start:1253 stop:1561 length:309 start_codon:yes stop_codon:yes gene_type:complete
MTDLRPQRNDPAGKHSPQRSSSRASGRAAGAVRHRSPEGVLRDPLLTSEEKLDLLEHWAQGEWQIAIAVQEGMPGPEPKLLRRTLEALRTLQAQEATEVGPK